MIALFRLLFFGYLFVSLCSGCAKYQKQSLTKRDYEERSCFVSSNNIDLSVTLFTPKESHSYLPNYRLLHLKIKNKTDEAIRLDAQNVSLPLAKIADIKKQHPPMYVKNLIPSFILCLSGIFFWWNICLPLAVVLGFSGIEYSAHQNSKIIESLKKIALFDNNSVIIAAHSTQDIVCFINKETYSPQFTVAFTTEKGGSYTFDVNIIAKVKHVYKVI